MMTEFELTPLRDEEQEVVNYGIKANGTSESMNGQLISHEDGRKVRKELRFMPTRIVMKRKHKLFRAIVIFLVILLILVICLLLGFYLNETKRRKSEETNFVQTHVNMKPVLPRSSVFVRSFKSYLHLKDSRVFEAAFSNGTVLKAYGLKGFASNNFEINWLTISNFKNEKTRIRFGDQNNMAYVLLSNGAQVNYEWSRDLTSIDFKIYLSSQLTGLDAKSFIFTVKLLDYAPLFQIIFKTLCGKGNVDDFPRNLMKKECISYLPLRVSKCGSKNAYNGAFLEGKISLGGNSHLIIPALLWPSLPDDCFQQSADSDSMSNFYIPLPKGPIDDSTCSMATKYFMKVCSVVPMEIDFKQVCYNISRQINGVGNRHFDQLVDILFESCVSLLSSLVLMCSALQTGHNPYSHAHSPFFLLMDRSVRNRLCPMPQISNPFPSGSVTVNVLAFCPSEPPITSPDQLIYFNGSRSVGNTLHINCPGPPEVTLYQLGHIYTGNNNHLTTLKHNFRFCAKCAYESVVSVRVLDNEVCCKNMCANDNTSVCALGSLGLEEKFQFKTHGNLYCHNFLDDTKSETSALDIKCTGDCINHFTIDFKMTNFREQTIFYHQPIKCKGSRSQMCNSKFGT
ncbi:hypothetical protein SNE40_008189 [Patella caerulea]|uniref:Uncharacterized protein n=1 Tax=Patella caerulea TaxID=87958 RepID=A0AAN8K0P4_PATCE